MQWIDYVAVPAGMVLIIAGFYLSIKGTRVAANFNVKSKTRYVVCPGRKHYYWGKCCPICVFCGLLQVYTAYQKRWLFGPLGVISVGFVLFMMGAVMGVGPRDI